MRLKIEINCREYFSVLGYIFKELQIETGWFNGSCNIPTYYLEEMLGTKIRALYQRKKDRDLYDLYKAHTMAKLNINQISDCYNEYINFAVDNPPTKKQYLQNMELKMKDKEFLGDTVSLLRVGDEFDYNTAYELVKAEILDRIWQ